MSEVIPTEAVEAARESMLRSLDQMGVASEIGWGDIARAALQAAAPHMLAGALSLADKWQEDFPYKANELRAALGVNPCER